MEIIVNSFNELLHLCKDKSKIVVSGPQRSGTTFIAKSLSSEHKPYVDEFDNPKQKESYVHQFAAKSHLTHKVSCDLVIWMLRKEDDVLKSEARINWRGFDAEKTKYKKTFGDSVNDFSSNYKMKHHYWNTFQKHNMKSDYVVFRYEDAVDADGFVEKEKRRNFGPKQTC